MHYTDENGDVVASDTFEVPAQGEYVVAGISVHEDVYRRVEQAWAEAERLRDGIREAVEGLDRADAYDTQLYERLTALLGDTRISATESNE